jgi:hypothetical protein
VQWFKISYFLRIYFSESSYRKLRQSATFCAAKFDLGSRRVTPRDLSYDLTNCFLDKYEIFVLGEVFDGSRCVLQPTSISTNGGTNRPVLVIVQNPGMSDFAFDVVKEPKKPKGSFNFSPSFQETRRPSSLLPATTLKRSDSSPSLIRHEGLQLALRSSGDLSTSTESGSRRDNQLPGSCGRAVKEGSRCVDGKEDRNAMLFVNEVVVDVTALKGYSCLQFENSCGDSRTLHSRSSMSLQGFAPHLSSVV